MSNSWPTGTRNLAVSLDGLVMGQHDYIWSLRGLIDASLARQRTRSLLSRSPRLIIAETEELVRRRTERSWTLRMPGIAKKLPSFPKIVKEGICCH